jgi:hypothetical protein
MHTKSSTEEDGPFEDYGTVEASHYSWNEDESKYKPIKTRHCTDNDISSHFYAAVNEEKELKKVKGMLNCVDDTF